MTTPATARAGLSDLLRLGARVGWTLVRGPRPVDVGGLVCAWARETVARNGGGAGLRIAIPGKPVELVVGHDRSEEVFAEKPGGRYCAGRLKVDAMRFLAPEALVIADGEAWSRLRPFNEGALGTGGPHPSAETFLAHVRDAFSRPVTTRADVQDRMGRVMTAVVLGGTPGSAPHVPDAAEDVTTLFDVVQSPVRRKLFGRFYRGRRRRLYDLLRLRWRQADPSAPTLLGAARAHVPEAEEQTLLEQMPHWMFTFTGSGTDLLTRTLALVTARPETRRRVMEECARIGAVDGAEALEGLAFTRACVLETGRLFPPVTRTFHRPTADGADAEIVHYFPLLQRDDALGGDVHAFRPERWLAAEPDAACAASNLFLRGPRACPGADLILSICVAAVARQVGELRLAPRASRLSKDPLPVSFPEREARFDAPEAST
ncbi:MAG TPA: hypothetical protein VJ997_09340 [Longimicrobiales bacterium]|nr:hypothetical protein [Longimicrobiales bacterium]